MAQEDVVTSLKNLAQSLQATSRALSSRGGNDSLQATMQETVVSILGLACLDSPESIGTRTINDGQAPRQSGLDLRAEQARALTRLQALRDTEFWVSEKNGNAVLSIRVADADAWDVLPALLQNHVKAEHLPCRLLLFIRQFTMPGESRYRHCAEPLAIILRAGKPEVIFPVPLPGLSHNRDEATAQALRHLHPFMSMFYQGLTQ